MLKYYALNQTVEGILGMAKHDEHLEIEEKVELSVEDLQRMFKKYKEQAVGEITVKSHPRHYYDTKELELRENKISMRIECNEDGTFVQTIKFPEPNKDGHKVVKEIEDEVETASPAFDAIGDKDAKQRMSEFNESGLRHLYTTNVPAPKFFLDVELQDGRQGRVEISFDVGEIYLSSKYQVKYGCFERVPVCEIEVEYVSGDIEAIDLIIAEILSECPSASTITKGKGSRGASLYKDARAKHNAQKTISRLKK
jgi:inorganic triphosphatase YgiF